MEHASLIPFSMKEVLASKKQSRWMLRGMERREEIYGRQAVKLSVMFSHQYVIEVTRVVDKD
jgi:hypothetical protein